MADRGVSFEAQKCASEVIGHLNGGMPLTAARPEAVAAVLKTLSETGIFTVGNFWH